MSSALGVRSPSPPAGGALRWLLRRVCTSNPFYVISAALFLVGLRLSFGAPARDIDTWALMSGLAGYTLLLALTALVLVRFLDVWDDARTVLLLVVLMFLATSVTFDEVLVLDPARGTACYLMGLAFAMAVSEGLLHGIRLRLPALFRLPYHLILALFFLYPLALRPLVNVNGPQGEALLWGLFAFSTVAGAVFLTLVPAVWRGEDYVADNGSPWGWPLYPWTLFGLLALAVPARAFLLCWSMHLLGGGDANRLIFGPYFVVPFGLAVAALLLEIGRVANRPGAATVGLAVPALLLVLAGAGHRDDPVYREFLDLFEARLGATPLFLTLLAATGLYAYAAARRIRGALALLMLGIVGLSAVGPASGTFGDLVAPGPAPLLAASMLLLILGAIRRDPWRSLAGAVGAAVAVALSLPGWQLAAGFHLVVAALLIVGAVFDDEAARRFRLAGGVLVLLACVAVMVGGTPRDLAVVPWLPLLYPLLLGALLGAYGWLLGHPASVRLAAAVLLLWLVLSGWRGYVLLRQVIHGLDYLAGSLGVLAVAVVISLAKSRQFRDWLGQQGTPAPLSPGIDAAESALAGSEDGGA